MNEFSETAVQWPDLTMRKRYYVASHRASWPARKVGLGPRHCKCANRDARPRGEAPVGFASPYERNCGACLMLPAPTLRFLVRQMLIVATLIAIIVLSVTVDLSHYVFGAAAMPFAQRCREFGVDAITCVAVIATEVVMILKFRHHTRLLDGGSLRA